MSYTTKDFLEGRIILYNPNRDIDLMSKLIKQIYPNDRKSLPTGNSRYYYTENGKWKGTDHYGNTPFNGKTVDIKTLVFSDVIDYEEGDWVVVQSYNQCKEGNGIPNDNHVGQLRKTTEDSNASGMSEHNYGVNFEVYNGSNWCRIRNSHIIRLATKAEINIMTQKLNEGDTYILNGNKRVIVKEGNFFRGKCVKSGLCTAAFKEQWFLYQLLTNKNYTDYKPINNQNNEQTRKTPANNNGKRKGTAISSSSNRQVASASRLVGNAKTCSIKETRIGRSKISARAISI